MAKFFDPDEEEDFDVLGPLSWLVKCCPPSALESFHLSKTRSWCFDIRSAPSLNSGGSVLPTFNGVMVI